MALPKFTVTGTIYDILGHTNGGELEPQYYGKELWTRAKVTFRPNVARGQLVEFEGELYNIKPVVAEVMPDGTLAFEGDPVTLVANDPGLSIEGLQYRVEIQGAHPFVIDALEDGETLDLSEVTPVAATNATQISRGPRGYPVDEVERDGDDLVFKVQGNEVGAVNIGDLTFDGTATEVGKAVLASPDEGAARTAIGGTEVGQAVFTAETEEAAREAIGAQAEVYQPSGAVADGTADDRAALAAADTAAQASGVPILLRKGVYKVSSSLTISSPVRVQPGAIIKPDNGITVTLAGGVDAPLRQIFDISGGGKVRLGNSTLYPEYWGAVGDGATDDSAAIRMMFNDSIAAFGGGHIHIPAGKVYASSMPIDMKSNTYVDGAGTLKCLAFHGAGMFVQYKNAVKNVTWIGPTVDINGLENMNGHAIGDVPNTTDFVSDIHIEGKVVGTRIDKELEAVNTYFDDEPVLYAGGGKGITIQFRARNVYANIITEDCDIACSVEAAVSDDRWLENVVLDIHAKDSHRTALFIGGSRDTISSANSGSYMHSLYPGVKVRLRAQGGQDGVMYSPVSGEVDGDNWSNAGVVTLNYASGVDLEVYAAVEERCTLVRGMAAASTIRITNALLDHLEDVWDTRPIDTLPPAGSMMSDNVFEANVHAATHHGVVVRADRTSGGTPRMIKTSLDISMWCQDGVGPITQDDSGVTDSFGASTAYRFRDMRANPVKEVCGLSSMNAKPQWALATDGGLTFTGNLKSNNFVPAVNATVTAAGTTTLDAASAQTQVFTGTSTQTVKLPTTGIVAGQTYTIVNQSTNTLAVQSANANAVITQFPNKVLAFTALVDTPTAAADWQITGMAATTATGAQTLAMRDTNSNLTADVYIPVVQTTTTSGGTATLTISNTQVQVFTGSNTHTVILPTTSVVAGMQYTIINYSSGAVAVKSSAGDLVHTLAGASLSAPSSVICVPLVSTPTAAGHWRAI